MMNWPSLLARLVPILATILVVLTALGVGLVALAMAVAAVIIGLVVSEYSQPWLVALLGRVLAMGRIVDASYEVVITTNVESLEKLKEELAQVEGELPNVLARENIQVSSTKPIEDGVEFEGRLLGTYVINGSIALATGARNQARIVVTLTAYSIPYKDLDSILHSLFLASIGGNHTIRDVLRNHGVVITTPIRGRVVITTRGKPALLDYVPRGFGSITLTKSFGVKEYRITMSYNADTHTGYLVIEGPWGYVEEITRELLPLYT